MTWIEPPPFGGLCCFCSTKQGYLMNLPQQCSTVAVVGNGIIGHGVAQIFAMAGREVRLIGRSEPSLSAAMRKIEASLQEFAAHGLLEGSAREEILGRIEPTTDLNRA